MREANYGIGSWTPFKVDCYTLDFVRDGLRSIDGLWKIKHFVGEMRITDLPTYPVRFHPDTAGLLNRMEERGLKYLMSPGHNSYQGPSAEFPLFSNDPVREIDGDVYIEFSAKERRDSGLVMSRAEVTEAEELVGNDYRWLTGNEVDTRRPEEFMAKNRFKPDVITVEEAKISADCLRLLPWNVSAHIFRLRCDCKSEEAADLQLGQPKTHFYRSWRIRRALTKSLDHLDIDLIQEIDRRPAARDLSFNELAIPDKTRTLLIILVEDHASKAKASCDPTNSSNFESSLRPQVDLVRGKGQGLIILLHGPPGSGKTSTAETIAAYTQRPLYSITCGDLGPTAWQVEKNLSLHTRRAGKWGCVLILDEADVFSMQRNWQDMERNALVSGETQSESPSTVIDECADS